MYHPTYPIPSRIHRRTISVLKLRTYTEQHIKWISLFITDTYSTTYYFPLSLSLSPSHRVIFSRRILFCLFNFSTILGSAPPLSLCKNNY